MPNDFQANTETHLAFIIEKLDKLATSIDEKTVKQTVFVKARPGLGHTENESSPSSSTQDKLNRELTEKADTLDRALHECRSQKDFWKKRLKCLKLSLITPTLGFQMKLPILSMSTKLKGKPYLMLISKNRKTRLLFALVKGNMAMYCITLGAGSVVTMGTPYMSVESAKQLMIRSRV